MPKYGLFLQGDFHYAHIQYEASSHPAPWNSYIRSCLTLEGNNRDAQDLIFMLFHLMMSSISWFLCSH